MALASGKVPAGQMVIDIVCSGTDPSVCCFSKHCQLITMSSAAQGAGRRKLRNNRLRFLTGGSGNFRQRSCSPIASRIGAISCMSTGTCNGERKESTRKLKKNFDASRNELENDGTGSLLSGHRVITRSCPTASSRGLAVAYKFACNDAKYVNERARNDIVLLSRGITRLNDRARQDVAALGMGFLKLDARAREDTEKIDLGMKEKAARLHHIAMIFKDTAETKLKSAADQHWSNGALEADLRRADILAKRRALEDAYMALKFIKGVHDMMVNKLLPKEDGTLSVNDMLDSITLERNGKAFDPFPGEVSLDRIAALQEAYWSMASALSEADGIDYTDPEELEFLVRTLIDLDAMDGKSSVSLLVECSSSPDVNTRKALANALASAPSMWTLGNAGMGALQRLAEDSNPAIATAASKAISELRRQWEVQAGDSLTFTMKINQDYRMEDTDETAAD